ncbi:MAG: S9 family peptidase [Crocinitomicaceae bacterium]|nr:S9 family peptidase [Crocinitomicaceae bacterium]
MRLQALFIGFILLASTLHAQEKLTVEKIWKQWEFSGDRVQSFSSMSDGNFFTRLEGSKINKYAFKKADKIVETIFDGSTTTFDGKNIKVEDYFFNADETKLLLATNIQSIYRRSFTAKYYIYDTKTKKLDELSGNPNPEQLAEFSPDGTKVAFVRDNNLFYKDLASGKELIVTKDGRKNAIINGTADWVYEEEFAITKGFYWSSDSKKIAYYRFDESLVKEFTMFYYQDLYPENYTFKYPKAGERNSKVQIFIFDCNTGYKHSSELKDYEYIPRIKWAKDPNKLIVLTMNRHQSKLDYNLIEMFPVKNNVIKVNQIYSESSKTYVEIDDNLIFLEDGSGFIRTSEMNGYNHIYKIGFDGNATQITNGTWDVIEFKGLDQKNGIIYYTSAEEGAMYSALYSIKLDGSGKNKLSTQKGNNDAQFSNGMRYYVNYYSNINTPSTITLHDSKGKLISTLVDNSSLNARLAKYDFGKKEFVQFDGAEGKLNGWILKPKNFDPNKKYPIYFNVYCGPGHNTVVDQWEGANHMFHHLLAQEDYVVVSVDPRGTMYRGADFKKSTYLQLGKLETEDVIAVAKNLQKESWVDADRIGIMGWSYGGYMSSLAITKGADVFKMAIAVAPVTNWKYYDNIYTERFMRTPQENNGGYEDNSPINHVDKLKGKYLLVHGDFDDNVHVQNTMEMVNRLVAKGKDFDLFIYPNRNHSIYGGGARAHLFNKILTFIKSNL